MTLRREKLFSFTTKDKNEDPYLACLKQVLLYFKRLYKEHSDWGPIPVITVRSDYMRTYKSRKVLNFYQDNDCKCELSSPYQHRQVAVERDVQTVMLYGTSLAYSMTHRYRALGIALPINCAIKAILSMLR